MHVFDLQFSDGKRCRCISTEPDADEAAERASIDSIFHQGYLTAMTRIIAPPPEKLPWKRQAENLWTIDNGERVFCLSKMPNGNFRCFWSGGDVEGGKDVISSAVRENWSSQV